MEDQITQIRIPKRVLKLMKEHPNEQSWSNASELTHTSDHQAGITRIRKGKGFQYEMDNAPVKDKEILSRIEGLVIPPAWEHVWISPIANGHLQATGIDQKKRKQYLYHPLWIMYRGQTKFDRLYEFGEILPAIRQQIAKDLSQPGLPKSKVIASIVAIMEQTTIRIGNPFYEKLYGSFGLSTMKNRHVKINGNELRFMFKGKKGIYHDISFKSRRLAKLIQSCKDIPGKELFQYVAEDGTIHSIESGDVNQYIHELTQNHYTSKDFRTWAGSVECIAAIHSLENEENLSKKSMNAIIDKVAEHLGNTRNVCKKYYIHPSILEFFEKDKLFEILNTHSETPPHWDGLKDHEVLLMKLLIHCKSAKG
jgi:DNA topoisomerase-1